MLIQNLEKFSILKFKNSIFSNVQLSDLAFYKNVKLKSKFGYDIWIGFFELFELILLKKEWTEKDNLTQKNQILKHSLICDKLERFGQLCLFS